MGEDLAPSAAAGGGGGGGGGWVRVGDRRERALLSLTAEPAVRAAAVDDGQGEGAGAGGLSRLSVESTGSSTSPTYTNEGMGMGTGFSGTTSGGEGVIWDPFVAEAAAAAGGGGGGGRAGVQVTAAFPLHPVPTWQQQLLSSDGWALDPVVVAAADDSSLISDRHHQQQQQVGLLLPADVWSQLQGSGWGLRIVVGAAGETGAMVDSTISPEAIAAAAAAAAADAGGDSRHFYNDQEQQQQRVIVYLPDIPHSAVLQVVVLASKSAAAAAGGGGGGGGGGSSSSGTSSSHSRRDMGRREGGSHRDPKEFERREHTADVLLAELSLLVLPSPIADELHLLFETMTEECGGATAVAYSHSFAPLSRDLASALAGPHVPITPPATAAAAAADYGGQSSSSSGYGFLQQQVVSAGQEGVRPFQEYEMLVSELSDYLREQGCAATARLLILTARKALRSAVAESGFMQPLSSSSSADGRYPQQQQQGLVTSGTSVTRDNARAVRQVTQQATAAQEAAAAAQAQAVNAEAAVAAARAALAAAQATRGQVARQAAAAERAARRAATQAAAASRRQAAVAAAAAVLEPGTVPQEVGLKAVLWGWEQQGLEVAYQRYKSSSLIGQDYLTLMLQLLRQMLLAWRVGKAGVTHLASGLVFSSMSTIGAVMVLGGVWMVVLGFVRLFPGRAAVVKALCQGARFWQQEELDIELRPLLGGREPGQHPEVVHTTNGRDGAV